MNNPKDMPAQPAPASSKYPERENLFQFLLELSRQHKVRVEYPYLPGDSPFIVYSIEEDELGVDHYD